MADAKDADPQKTGVRFVEAIDFLRRRLALPDGRWAEILREVDRAARDRSAGMTDALVRDILAAILKSLEEGTTFDAFLDEWDEATRRHGWSASEADPGSGSGAGSENARRAALAFRMMTSQAYAAGRWAQAQRLKASRPWLRYVHVDPDLTQPGSRHAHAAWHGVILPVDDPWWETHFPPNGFNCRCYVQSVSERDLGRYGWTVASEAPPERTEIVFVKGRDGGRRAVETPIGVDPGFGVNVGKLGLRRLDSAV